MIRKVLCTLAFVASFMATTASGQTTLTVAQTPAGNTIATLAHLGDSCMLIDGTTLTSGGPAFEITTTFHPKLECFGVPAPGGAKTLNVDFGVLPPGHYSVVWWILESSGSQPASPYANYAGEFDVAAPLLDPIATPTLSQWATFALLALVLIAGIAALWRRPSYLDRES